MGSSPIRPLALVAAAIPPAWLARSQSTTAQPATPHRRTRTSSATDAYRRVPQASTPAVYCPYACPARVLASIARHPPCPHACPASPATHSMGRSAGMRAPKVTIRTDLNAFAVPANAPPVPPCRSAWAVLMDTAFSPARTVAPAVLMAMQWSTEFACNAVPIAGPAPSLTSAHPASHPCTFTRAYALTPAHRSTSRMWPCALHALTNVRSALDHSFASLALRAMSWWREVEATSTATAPASWGTCPSMGSARDAPWGAASAHTGRTTAPLALPVITCTRISCHQAWVLSSTSAIRPAPFHSSPTPGATGAWRLARQALSPTLLTPPPIRRWSLRKSAWIAHLSVPLAPASWSACPAPRAPPCLIALATRHARPATLSLWLARASPVTSWSATSALSPPVSSATLTTCWSWPMESTCASAPVAPAWFTTPRQENANSLATRPPTPPTPLWLTGPSNLFQSPTALPEQPW